MGEYLFVIIMKKQSMTSLINGHAKTRKPHTSKSNKKKKKQVQDASVCSQQKSE